MIENTKKWFEVAAPHPTDTSRTVQTGCHLEEVVEFLGSLRSFDRKKDWLDEEIDFAAAELNHLAETLKVEHPALPVPDRVEHLDALCDQIVTAVGVAHMYGYDIIGALNEVNRSNFSKFVNGDPVFNEHGKIAKGADYTPPNLEPFV